MPTTKEQIDKIAFVLREEERKTERLGGMAAVRRTIAFVVLAILVLAALVHAARSEERHALTPAEQAKAEQMIYRLLKDPDSAKFSSWQAFTASDGGLTICVMVNAKNSYGGYTGAQHYALVTEKGQLRNTIPNTHFDLYEQCDRLSPLAD